MLLLHCKSLCMDKQFTCLILIHGCPQPCSFSSIHGSFPLRQSGLSRCVQLIHLLAGVSHSGSPKFDDLILAQHCILPSSLERREVEHWVLLLRTRLPLGAFYHCSHRLFQYQHTLSYNLPNLHVGTLWNIPHVRGHHIAMKRKKKKKDQKKLSNINASTHTFTRPSDS